MELIFSNDEMEKILIKEGYFIETVPCFYLTPGFTTKHSTTRQVAYRLDNDGRAPLQIRKSESIIAAHIEQQWSVENQFKLLYKQRLKYVLGWPLS